MLREYKMQTFVCVWGGFVFGLFGFLISVPGTAYEVFGRLLIAGGWVLMACGCFFYALGKGYGWSMGLMGLFGPLGAVFIYLLRDKSALMLKKRKKEES